MPAKAPERLPRRPWCWAWPQNRERIGRFRWMGNM